jgi:hypothetical protein
LGSCEAGEGTILSRNFQVCELVVSTLFDCSVTMCKKLRVEGAFSLLVFPVNASLAAILKRDGGGYPPDGRRGLE